MEARLKNKVSKADSLFSISVFLSEWFGTIARTNRTPFYWSGAWANIPSLSKHVLVIASDQLKNCYKKELTSLINQLCRAMYSSRYENTQASRCHQQRVNKNDIQEHEGYVIRQSRKC